MDHLNLIVELLQDGKTLQDNHMEVDLERVSETNCAFVYIGISETISVRAVLWMGNIEHYKAIRAEHQ